MLGVVTKSFNPSNWSASPLGTDPCITKSNKGLPQSLLVILTVTLCAPAAVGVNAITNEVVALAAKVLAGNVVKEKKEAPVPIK